MREFTAAERLAATAMARADLYFFSRYMFLQRRKFTWRRAPQHKVICEALERVFRGEVKNLVINVPPRYSKTELAAVNFIPWALGHHPDAEFIHVSYSGRLAANNSWHAKELVLHPAYREIFPDVALRADTQARDHWTTTRGGVVFATSMGGTVTGFGAGKARDGFGGAIIIDDPHKADEAKSEVIRGGVLEWYQNTLESRRNTPDTPIILIMQRLHQHDLAGWLLEGNSGETWEHVCMPAIQPDGTALWPEKHSIETLRRMQSANPYVFAGQYQQRPSPSEGGQFKPERLQIVDALPAGLSLVRAWDFAGTKGGGDWTVGFLLGRLGEKWYIADVIRFREGPEFVEAALVNTAKNDGTACRISIPQDPGQAGKAQAQRFVGLLVGFTVTATPESGDKGTRANPLAAQVNVGNVYMLRASWNHALIEELRMFPNGENDDQVDAAARAFNEHATQLPHQGLFDYFAQEAAKLKEQHDKAKGQANGIP
jgi:predicted phage terminase large subunit-like protein